MNMAKNNVKKKVSSKKRRNIIDAALSTFLEFGYGETSIDEIVKRAGGSKATVYSHFKNKEDLFTTVVDELVKTTPVSNELNPDDPPEETLLAFANSRLIMIFRSQLSALRRLLIGEAARFPKIARMYYTHGPDYGNKLLQEYFMEQHNRGTLKIDDVELAVDIFQGMLIHSFNLKSLFVIKTRFTSTELSAHAKKVVKRFIQLYGN